jgi:catechol 2,3-dioxygenase-like lactoylglutathione lyase family enzyme
MIRCQHQGRELSAYTQIGLFDKSIVCSPFNSWHTINLKENPMKQSIIHIALVVRDYDEALDFFLNKLNFVLIEDTYQPEQDKRWVVVAPPGGSGTTLLLARASKPEQEPFIGNQTGGRVFLFLNTDDFWRDYNNMLAKGIKFIREPKQADYGMVAVFEDLYGNLWDLLQLNEDHPVAMRVK